MIVLVANPTAGGGKGGRLLPQAVRALSTLDEEHRVVVSESPDHPERAAREAVHSGASAVAAMGGDGLVGACANALIGTDTTLAVIPAGSGNDFARRLGLDHRRPLATLGLLAAGRRRRIDAALAEGEGWSRHYVCVAGTGFDSVTNEVANRIRRLRGTAKYLLAVARTLRSFRPADFDIRVDGDEVGASAMMVAVGNAGSYGGGMKVVPDASLDDGILDVCIVGAMSRRRFVAAFPRVYRGTHVTHPDVTMLTGRKIEVRASRSFPVYADGEPLGPLPATFTVQPDALEVIAP